MIKSHEDTLLTIYQKKVNYLKWPLDDLWPNICWCLMCHSTQGSLCPTPMVIQQSMWIQWLFFKNLTRSSMTPRWPLNSKMTFDPTSIEVTYVTLPKDHCIQVPWKYVKVCGYSDNTLKKKTLNQRSLIPRWPLTQRTWVKGHWSLDDLWPKSVEVTCVTLPKDHCVQVPWKHIKVYGYSDLFFKNLNQGHCPLDDLWPMSTEVTCVTRPKDHSAQVPWESINVCRYSDQFCKIPHTYNTLHTDILRTEWVIT